MKTHNDEQSPSHGLFPTSCGHSVLRTLGIAAVAMFLAATVGCEKEGPIEEAAEETEDAIESAGDAVEEAADEAEDALESAGDAVEDSADEMEDEVDEEME